MPRKSRVEDDHASVQVEMMIPVRQVGRAKALEKARGPAVPIPPALPRIPRVTRLMALAIKFQDMVDRGEVRDYADLARLGHVTRARMSQIMNLLLLAPEIQEEILRWERPVAVDLCEREMRPVINRVSWCEQRAEWLPMREKLIGPSEVSTDRQSSEHCGGREATQNAQA
jgi:hypothetical protein